MKTLSHGNNDQWGEQWQQPSVRGRATLLRASGRRSRSQREGLPRSCWQIKGESEHRWRVLAESIQNKIFSIKLQPIRISKRHVLLKFGSLLDYSTLHTSAPISPAAQTGHRCPVLAVSLIACMDFNRSSDSGSGLQCQSNSQRGELD